MCIFSSSVLDVDKTRIFARRASPESQFLVYSMQYQADRELAMILPLPKPPGADEEVVRFIDLSGYPDFFEDMASGFPPQDRGTSLGRSRYREAPPTLEVHDVGSFEASWVPTLSDFDRLDERFRLSPEIWSQLPQYATYGFAVFKLKPGEKSIHPMAFEFKTRDPYGLFFPTVHVHDGSVEPKAHFHHALYCQLDDPGKSWNQSKTRDGEPFLVGDFVDVARSQGLVLPDRVVFRRSLEGSYPNRDTWVPG